MPGLLNSTEDDCICPQLITAVVYYHVTLPSMLAIHFREDSWRLAGKVADQAR